MTTRWPFPSWQDPAWLAPPGPPDPHLAACRDAVRALARQPGRSAAPGDVAAALTAASELADRIDWVLLSLVGEARGAGLSWEDVGQALGVSKQAAHKRFSPFVAAAVQQAAEHAAARSVPAARVAPDGTSTAPIG